ncbi:hypothetical protein CDAR_223371 [Caerostris darwini]|uniref:Uncharacterized protein n=1 Tax=Caerostris darwini TaxID=1538125 RepID=A0AAV4W7T5_9ARAC|nr:hypothetical protein CDAR_223371 [Caerostris darwini]
MSSGLIGDKCSLLSPSPILIYPSHPVRKSSTPRFKSVISLNSIPSHLPTPPPTQPPQPLLCWKTNFISRQQTPYFVFAGRRFSLYANPKPYLRALHSVHGYCLLQPPFLLEGGGMGVEREFEDGTIFSLSPLKRMQHKRDSELNDRGKEASKANLLARPTPYSIPLSQSLRE